MTQIEFNITFPKRINDIFYISQDKSEWNNKTKYIKKGNNPVPNRDKTLSEVNSELVDLYKEYIFNPIINIQISSYRLVKVYISFLY